MQTSITILRSVVTQEETTLVTVVMTTGGLVEESVSITKTIGYKCQMPMVIRSGLRKLPSTMV